MDTKKRLAYPIEEAFNLIGVSRTRGYQLINAGTLRTYKVGKRRLCSHEALVECQQTLENGTQPKKAA